MGTQPQSHSSWRRPIRGALRLGEVCAVLVLLVLVYWFGVRPRQLHWGATSGELRTALPEDGIVAYPAFDATRAITIHARPEQIWPWLVQMGYGRAGFYGYDLIENPGGGRGLQSATAILPEFQHLRTGDTLPLSVAASLEFGTIEPNRVLVWRSRGIPHSGVFIWALVPIDAGHTRLISRIRWRYLSDPVGRALGLFTEVSDHVAVKAILRGVRDRAEGCRPPSLVLQGFEIAGWLVAMLELLWAMGMILWSRHPVAWACVAACTGLMLMFLLYADAPAWLNALVPWAWLAAMLAAARAGGTAARIRHPSNSAAN